MTQEPKWQTWWIETHETLKAELSKRWPQVYKNKMPSTIQVIEISALKELVEALQWYADCKKWKYTTYDNLHMMADDARTIKLPGGIYDVSGRRACEALSKLPLDVLAEIERKIGEAK